MNVSQAIAKVMKAYGAEYVFTLTGAPQDPLIEMQNHEEIRVVLGRSERSALFMADAYARLTGKPTFGIVQFGPGATYLPASIIDAYWANSPLIAISGSITTRTKYRYEYQEIDQTGMFPAMTKWCGDLPAPEARSAFPAAPWTPRARLRSGNSVSCPDILDAFFVSCHRICIYERPIGLCPVQPRDSNRARGG